MKNATQPEIGKLIDEAMEAIKKENPEQLRGVLPRIYAQANMPPFVLGRLINLFSKISFELAQSPGSLAS
jgi:type I restriction enzyme M protein